MMNKGNVKARTNDSSVWNFVSLPGLESEEDYFKHHEEKYKLVRKVIEEYRPKKILDVGIATGIFYSTLPNVSTYEIHGVEVNQEFIPVLEKRGIVVHACNVEIESIPCPEGSFDLVICDSILEHSLKPKHLLMEVARVLRPGGSFILVVPNATSIVRRWNFMRGRNVFWPLIDNLLNKNYMERCAVFYSESELRYSVERSGLVIDTVTYLDERFHDKRSVSNFILRGLSCGIARFRDVIFIQGRRIP